MLGGFVSGGPDGQRPPLGGLVVGGVDVVPLVGVPPVSVDLGSVVAPLVGLPPVSVGPGSVVVGGGVGSEDNNVATTGMAMTKTATQTRMIGSDDFFLTGAGPEVQGWGGGWYAPGWA